MTKRFVSMSVLMLLGGLLLAPAGLADEKKAAEKKPEPPESPIVKAAHAKSAADDEVVVITNESLEAMIADLPPSERARGVYQSAPRPETAAEAPAGQAPQDPLKWMEQREAARKETAAQRVEAEKRVETLRARVRELEDRLLKLRNPLLARPQTPTDAEGQPDADWAKMDTKARVDRSEQELRDARQALSEAEAALAALPTAS